MLVVSWTYSCIIKFEPISRRPVSRDGKIMSTLKVLALVDLRWRVRTINLKINAILA